MIAALHALWRIKALMLFASNKRRWLDVRRSITDLKLAQAQVDTRAEVIRSFQAVRTWLLTWNARPTSFFPSRARVIMALLFICFSLPTCLLLALMVPTGQVADEHNHLIRAAGLLRGEILGKRAVLHTPQGEPFLATGLIANPGLSLAIGSSKKLTHSEVDRLKGIPWAKAGIYFNAPNTATYMPAFYLPSAAAIGISRILDLSPYTSILAARVSNVLCYVAIGALALLWTCRGHTLLFAALTLPMTLSLAASCNQDGLLIAATVLASALLTRSTGPRGGSYWTAGILLGSIIAVKPPYIALAALMLAPLTLTPFSSWNRCTIRSSLCGTLLATIPALIWTTISLYFVAVPLYVSPAYHPGPLWPGDPETTFHYLDPHAQMQVFLHNPIRLFVLPLISLGEWNNLLTTWQQMIGNFGWLDVTMPPTVYVMWTVALICAALNDVFFVRNLPDQTPRGLISALGLFAGLGALWGVLDSEYLAWTRVGNALISGLQGRYLLPILAAWTCALPSLHTPANSYLRKAFTFPVYGMAFYGMIFLPILMATTYYLP